MAARLDHRRAVRTSVMDVDTPMAGLTFPFWIVTQKRGLISQPVEPEGTPGFIAAFSSAQNAATFMVARGETEWENRLVARSTLFSLMSDLRRLGVQGICLDPTKEEAGIRLTFDELDRQQGVASPDRELAQNNQT